MVSVHYKKSHKYVQPDRVMIPDDGAATSEDTFCTNTEMYSQVRCPIPCCPLGTPLHMDSVNRAGNLLSHLKKVHVEPENDFKQNSLLRYFITSTAVAEK